MTENIEDVVASLSLSRVLISILETIGEVRVPTLTFIEGSNEDKELVVDYDETGPTFVFKLKNKENKTDGELHSDD